MNLANIDTKISELTKADSTVAYPTANRLINVNIWNQKVVTEILDSQDTSDFDDANYTGYAILESDLQANVRDYRFGISDGVVEVKRVDVTYDNENVDRANSLDTSDIDVGLIEAQTEVDTYFDSRYPYYEWKHNAIWLYPKPTASTGKISVEVSRTAKDFSSGEYTTGTVIPGFDQNFHVMLAYGAAYEYFVSNGMTEQAASMETILSDYRAKLRRQYGKKNREYPLRFQADFIDYN